MQSLGIVARLFPLVLSGEKTSTIRWREREIVPGPLRYVCDDDPTKTVVVTVHRCTSMRLADAARFVGREEEWPDPVMLSGMREHYPGIALTDIVQVIEHGPPTDGVS